MTEEELKAQAEAEAKRLAEEEAKRKSQEEADKQTKVEYVTKEDFNALTEMLKGLIPKEQPKQENKDEQKVDPKVEALEAELKALRESINGVQSATFTAKKEEFKAKFGLDDSDIADIKNENELYTFGKLLEKNKKAFETQLPDYLAKQGKRIADLNEANEKDKAKQAGKETAIAKYLQGFK